MNRHGIRLAALFAGGVAVVSCGSSGGGGGGGVTAPAEDAGSGGIDSGADVATSSAGSGLVTPSSGGVVRSADGRVELDVPPGAVADATVITVAPATTFLDDGSVVAGSVYAFSPDGAGAGVFRIPLGGGAVEQIAKAGSPADLVLTPTQTLLGRRDRQDDPSDREVLLG
jgi:hypothetical protein